MRVLGSIFGCETIEMSGGDGWVGLEGSKRYDFGKRLLTDRFKSRFESESIGAHLKRKS